MTYLSTPELQRPKDAPLIPVRRGRGCDASMWKHLELRLRVCDNALAFYRLPSLGVSEPMLLGTLLLDEYPVFVRPRGNQPKKGTKVRVLLEYLCSCSYDSGTPVPTITLADQLRIQSTLSVANHTVRLNRFFREITGLADNPIIGRNYHGDLPFYEVVPRFTLDTEGE